MVNEKIKVLNNGYISIVEHTGGDYSVIRNARRCWKSEDKSNEKSDANLIQQLLKAGHMTPFESMVFTFDVKCPLFVARQWFRHRIGSYNEESLRYCVAERDFWIPYDEAGDLTYLAGIKHIAYTVHAYCDRQFDAYEDLIARGLPKEQARTVLPTGIYTKFYWTVNGSSLMNFLRLRTDRQAQKEIRIYANHLLDIGKIIAPVCFGLWEDMHG